MSKKPLGRWGEDLVCKYLGYKRVPFSGGAWPHREDIVKRHGQFAGHLAQVKTTTGEAFVERWRELERNASVDHAKPVWYDVVRLPNEAYIFERRLVRVVTLGVGGEEV